MMWGRIAVRRSLRIRVADRRAHIRLEEGLNDAGPGQTGNPDVEAEAFIALAGEQPLDDPLRAWRDDRPDDHLRVAAPRPDDGRRAGALQPLAVHVVHPLRNDARR